MKPQCKDAVDLAALIVLNAVTVILEPKRDGGIWVLQTYSNYLTLLVRLSLSLRSLVSNIEAEEQTSPGLEAPERDIW